MYVILHIHYTIQIVFGMKKKIGDFLCIYKRKNNVLDILVINNNFLPTYFHVRIINKIIFKLPVSRLFGFPLFLEKNSNGDFFGCFVSCTLLEVKQ